MRRGTKILLMSAVALVGLGGYGIYTSSKARSRTVYSVVKIGLPKLGDITPTSPTLSRSGADIQETISFPGSTSGLAEDYVKWLKDRDWKAITESVDVNSYRAVLEKDNVTITVDFYSHRGTYVQGRRPAAEYDAAAP